MRNIHLILGLVFALILSVYTVSSVRIAHRSCFAGLRQTVTESTVAVDPTRASTPCDLGLQLIQEQDIRGEIRRVIPTKDGRFGVIIRRMGTIYNIRQAEGATEAQVRENPLVFT